MAGDNLALYVASYADAATASEDFRSLKDAQAASDDFKVVTAGILSHDADGKVDVKVHGTGEVAAATGIGAVGGLIVGLFSPPLLLATTIGAGLGAAFGELKKRHEEKKIGVDEEDTSRRGPPRLPWSSTTGISIASRRRLRSRPRRCRRRSTPVITTRSRRRSTKRVTTSTTPSSPEPVLRSVLCELVQPD